MKAIDRLYKREETITRSVHIDEDIYPKMYMKLQQAKL